MVFILLLATFATAAETFDAPESRCPKFKNRAHSLIDEFSDVTLLWTSIAILKSLYTPDWQGKFRISGPSLADTRIVMSSGSATHFYGCPHYQLEKKPEQAIIVNDIDAWIIGIEKEFAENGKPFTVYRGAHGYPVEIEAFGTVPGANDWISRIKQNVKPQEVVDPNHNSRLAPMKIEVADCLSLIRFKEGLLRQGVGGRKKEGEKEKWIQDWEDLQCLRANCPIAAKEKPWDEYEGWNIRPGGKGPAMVSIKTDADLLKLRDYLKADYQKAEKVDCDKLVLTEHDEPEQPQNEGGGGGDQGQGHQPEKQQNEGGGDKGQRHRHKQRTHALRKSRQQKKKVLH